MPCVYQGFESMFSDTLKMCQENDEEEKYLMTMQNMLSRVPKWNTSIIDSEVDRIKKESNCSYIGDLLTCVHVTHMKLLTSVRVGQKKKKLDISIPKLDVFVHDIYIASARQLYKNVYLFDIDVMPIEKQKHRREIEKIIQDSILDVIRTNMPIESILKAYLDETTEHEVYEEVEVEEKVVVPEKTTFDKIHMDKPEEIEKSVNFNEPLLSILPVAPTPVAPTPVALYPEPIKTDIVKLTPDPIIKVNSSPNVTFSENPNTVHAVTQVTPNDPSPSYLGATNDVLPFSNIEPTQSIYNDDFTIKIDNNPVDNIELDIETL
jgi:hypothetical protein